MSCLRSCFTALVFLVALTSLTDARAQTPARFDFVFEGTTTNAQATGYIVFDLDLLPNPGNIFPIDLPSPMVLDLGVTVTGSASGDGTFTINDFSGVVWSTGGVALNLNPGVQVVGQQVLSGPWGPGCGQIIPQGGGPIGCGDFNLFSAVMGPAVQSYGERGVSGAPNGVGPFTLSAGGSGENMELTSFIRGTVAPSIGVPALSAWSWSLMIGLLLIAGLVSVRLRG